MSKKKSNFRKVFRKNKTINHPTYLIDEVGNTYEYIGITHSSKVNEVDYIQLKKNPNPNDKQKAYISPVVKSDNRNNFGRRYGNWKFSNDDMKTVDEIVSKHKNKPTKK